MKQCAFRHNRVLEAGIVLLGRLAERRNRFGEGAALAPFTAKALTGFGCRLSRGHPRQSLEAVPRIALAEHLPASVSSLSVGGGTKIGCPALYVQYTQGRIR
jgi:hypothetical protein